MLLHSAPQQNRLWIQTEVPKVYKLIKNLDSFHGKLLWHESYIFGARKGALVHCASLELLVAIANTSSSCMEVPIRVGRLQSLREHLQSAPSHGHLTRSLYDGVRGCCFTISFPNSKPSALSYLVFRNFYTASMRLVQNSTDGSSVVLLDEHVLMQHIHCEDDAQNWHLLHLEKVSQD